MQLEKLTKSDWESILGNFGIVGTGGGCKGALSVGFMWKIFDLVLSKEIWPPVMWATSVNSLIFSAIIASHDISAVAGTFYKLESQGPDALFSKWEAALNAVLGCIINRNSLYSDRGLRRLMSGLDIQALADSSTELRFSVHREIARRGREYKVISSHDARFRDDLEDLLKFLRASASIAGFLPPVIIKGHTYSDGLRPPLMEAVRSHFQTILLLVNDMYLSENHAKANWTSRAGYSADSHYDEILTGQLSCAIEDHGYRILNASSSLPLVSSFRKLESQRQDSEDRGCREERSVDRVIVIAAAKKVIPHLITKGFSKEEHSISVAIKHGKECMREALEALVRFRRPDLI